MIDKSSGSAFAGSCNSNYPSTSTSKEDSCSAISSSTKVAGDSYSNASYSGDSEDGYGPLVAFQQSEWELFKQQCRTTQLIFTNQQGKMVTQLRQPRSLYAVSADSISQTAARWPTDKQVLTTRPLHLEYIPDRPEPLSHPQDSTFAPCTSELHMSACTSGKVVYSNVPDPDVKYFLRSRVGGSAVPPSPFYKLTGREDNTLLFESRFESGNLMRAVHVKEHDYQLWLQFDLYTRKYTQWYYFRIENAISGVQYRFTIMNLLKTGSLYNHGMRPLCYSEYNAVNHQIGWVRSGANIHYYRNDIKYEENGKERYYYSLTWTCQFQNQGDTYYFAHAYPYTYSDLQLYLSGIASDPQRSQCCKQRVLCRTLAGNQVYMLTITSQTRRKNEAQLKRVVVLSARVHPGETVSSWMMKGLIDFLTSSHQDAKILRRCFIFKLLPMLNPDGVIVGNYRCSLSGRDLNRNYKTVLKDAFLPVWHARAMIKRLQQERKIALYCDLHGHSRRQNVFIYGCENTSDRSSEHLQERVFPFMMANNAPDKFAYASCRFKVQKSKEGTGRIVMWKLGIDSSYTMEASFCGSTIGQTHGYHFSIADYEMVGYQFCDTLLDYCDPDRSKWDHCMTYLREQVAVSKQNRENPTAEDVTGSDTDGSDSSVSDGLPMQLLHATIPQIARRKKLRSKKERDKRRMKSDEDDVDQDAIVSSTGLNFDGEAPSSEIVKRKRKNVLSKSRIRCTSRDSKQEAAYQTENATSKKWEVDTNCHTKESIEKSRTQDMSHCRYYAVLDSLYGRKSTCEKCNGRMLISGGSMRIEEAKLDTSANDPFAVSHAVSDGRSLVAKAKPISPCSSHPVRFMTTRRSQGRDQVQYKMNQTLTQQESIEYLRRQLTRLLVRPSTDAVTRLYEGTDAATTREIRQRALPDSMPPDLKLQHQHHRLEGAVNGAIEEMMPRKLSLQADQQEKKNEAQQQQQQQQHLIAQSQRDDNVDVSSSSRFSGYRIQDRTDKMSDCCAPVSLERHTQKQPEKFQRRLDARIPSLTEQQQHKDEVSGQMQNRTYSPRHRQHLRPLVTEGASVECVEPTAPARSISDTWAYQRIHSSPTENLRTGYGSFPELTRDRHHLVQRSRKNTHTRPDASNDDHIISALPRAVGQRSSVSTSASGSSTIDSDGTIRNGACQMERKSCSEEVPPTDNSPLQQPASIFRSVSASYDGDEINAHHMIAQPLHRPHSSSFPHQPHGYNTLATTLSSRSEDNAVTFDGKALQPMTSPDQSRQLLSIRPKMAFERSKVCKPDR